MSSKRKSEKKEKLILNRWSIVAVTMFGILSIVLLAVWISYFLSEKRSLAELSSAGTDLKVVYGQIANKYEDTSAQSHFRYECHESSTEIGKGRIVCGPNATIYLKGTVSEQDLKDSVGAIVKGSGLFQGVSSGSSSAQGISLSFSHGSTDCYLSGNSKEISVYCIKTVPDFLPGYTVEK